MHIGYILTTFPALSETFVLNEILELERQGMTVTVFSLRKPRNEPRHPEMSQLRARIVYLIDDPLAMPSLSDLAEGALTYLKAILRGQFAELKNISRGMRVAAASRRSGVAALHAHFADRPASFAYWAHRMTGLPFSFTAHAIDIFDHGLTDGLMVTKLREARYVITVCDFNKKFMLDHYPGAIADRIHVINNCVDLKYFTFRESEPAGEAYILSVGRLVPKKGFDLLVRACAKLREQGKPVRFTIVGEGPEREILEALAGSLAVSDLVTFAGAAPHDAVRELLSRATIFCMPFRRTPSGDMDSLSLVLMEAMATGVPVISTNLGAIPEIVDSGENGLLVEPEDTAGLAEAIRTLLELPEMRNRLAAAAREKVERRFSLPVNVGQVRELLAQSPH
jgi:glycosyltransferase involved in cell wall biosynthesis